MPSPRRWRPCQRAAGGRRGRGQRGRRGRGGSGGEISSTSRDGRVPTVVPHARGSRATRRTLLALEPRDGPTDAVMFTHRRPRALPRALVDASVAPARDARPATLAIARGFHREAQCSARPKSRSRAGLARASRGEDRLRATFSMRSRRRKRRVLARCVERVVHCRMPGGTGGGIPLRYSERPKNADLR